VKAQPLTQQEKPEILQEDYCCNSR